MYLRQASHSKLSGSRSFAIAKGDSNHRPSLYVGHCDSKTRLRCRSRPMISPSTRIMVCNSDKGLRDDTFVPAMSAALISLRSSPSRILSFASLVNICCISSDVGQVALAGNSRNNRSRLGLFH